MSIIIDRNISDNNYLTRFDTSFTEWLYLYASDITFTDSDKRLIYGAQSASVNDWVYLPNLDIFNSLSIEMDLDLIISNELLRTYNSTLYRLLYYQINVDYHPIRGTYYSNQYVNVLLNLWEGLNSPDDTLTYFGLDRYASQPYFDVSNMSIGEPVQCILQMKPVARKVDSNYANLLRQTVDFIFMLMLNKNVTVCGVSP